MGVPEYWLFDPKGGLYPAGTPRLQGLKLVGGEYQSLESRLLDGERTIRSEVLGLDVRIDGELLRFRDVATGRDIQHHPEATAAAKQEADLRKTAEARAEREAGRAEREAALAKQEAAARSAAEARVAELEAALRSRMRGEL